MKIVINKCFGGFSLSRLAVLRAREIAGDPLWGGPTIIGDTHRDDGSPVKADFGFVDVDRHDPILVRVVEELGPKASGELAQLKVVVIPDGVQYTIEEYDGTEWVAESHRTWR